MTYITIYQLFIKLNLHYFLIDNIVNANITKHIIYNETIIN